MRLPLLVAWLTTGCLGVPDVTFGSDAQADRGVDTATESSPGLDGAEHDAAGFDAPADASAPSDAGAPSDAFVVDGAAATCPQGVPAGASVCCGSVPCKGSASACQNECTNCENDCAGQTCCLDKNGNYKGCAANPGACP
ncbi:MAG TPA: hypothetical protein VMI75_27825 [Polyangiaceae bacterium]|nr:hypothetical protein [Polyangiaceae bacterium]